MTSQQTQPRDHAIAVVSGADGENGHLEEFRTDPVGLMQRVRDECGDVVPSIWPTAGSCC